VKTTGDGILIEFPSVGRCCGLRGCHSGPRGGSRCGSWRFRVTMPLAVIMTSTRNC
jgi:hypothetical protein